MSDWIQCSLGDVLKLQRGHDLPDRLRQEGCVPVISSSGITGWHSQPKAKAPGVVTGRYGTLGEVFYVENDYWPLNTALYVIDFKGNDPRFVSYFLRNVLKNYKSDKAAVPGIDRNVAHQISVRCPGHDTQRRIVEILSPYDDLIENNRRRIALLEQAARELYREWFVRLRFPGHEHVGIVDGVPDGWERVPLGGLITLQRGFDLPTQHRREGLFPILASTGINGFHQTWKVPGPGVVTGRSGSLGTVTYVHDNFWPLNTALWIKEYKKLTPEFSYHLLSTLHLEQYNGGAAVPTLNRNDAHRIEVLCPSSDLMAEFNETAKLTLDQVRLLSQQNTKLSAARDLLLPRLMNGSIAV